MRGKIVLVGIVLLFFAVGVAAIVFMLSKQHVKKRVSSAPIAATVTDEPSQHAPKPSPGVPLQANKSSGASSTANPAASNAGPAQTAPWPPDGMQFTAHHKGHNGCDGVLSLKASGLEFTCPGDAHKSFSVALDQIRGTDDDGIATTSGAKYHFDKVPGGDKEYVERLFEQWLSRTRLAPSQPR